MAKATNLYIGQLFDSYCQFITYPKTYDKHHFVCFSKNDSRSIDTQKHSAKPELKFFKVRFVCVKGGRFRMQGTGKRKTSTINTGCPALIYLHSTPDGNNLEIRKLNECHNHEISEEAFKKLPQQRRLPPDVKRSAKEMLSLDVDKELLLQKLRRETGKLLTKKDLHNLAKQKKLHDRLEEIVVLQGRENVAETNGNKDVAQTYANENVAENNANDPVSLDHNYEEETTTNEPVSQENGEKIVFVQNRANKAVEDLVREKKRSNDLKERLLEESRKRNTYLEALLKSNDTKEQLLEESRRRNKYLETLLKLECINYNQSLKEPMQE